MLYPLSRLRRKFHSRAWARQTDRKRSFTRLTLERLEDRQLLSSFLVVLGTDNGGPTAQKVSATSGDLRYCVQQADAVHTATTDAIGFSSALTTTPHTITLNSANGPLVLSDSHPLTINGPAARTVNVSGGSQVEVFDIASGTVTIKNLAIIYGNAANGGGIYNQGTLTLSNCFLDHDTASSASGVGGGIFNARSVKLSNCTLYLDSAYSSAAGGGAIWNETNGTAILASCKLSNDSAHYGGAIYNNGGTASLTNCKLSNDSATYYGGAIYNAGTATLSNCTLNSDSASSGGGIYGTATLTNCTLSNDSALYYGGGIYGTATLTNCTLSNDSAYTGGGILNIGTAILTGCTLSGDSASGAGFPYGGGIWNEGTDTLTNCTLSDDVAPNGYGGGIFNYTGGTATLTNCTLANDSAPIANGGGIDNEATATLTNCTLSNNLARYGGGIFNQTVATLNLTNTIVARNTGTALGPDIFNNLGTITAHHDLIGDGTNGIATGGDNIVGGNGNPVIDPRLGPLQNNGGPTETMALLPDSPAIGEADNAMATSSDQRGVIRVDEAGETTDIGAFEF